MIILLIFDFENQIVGDFDPNYSGQIAPKVRC